MAMTGYNLAHRDRLFIGGEWVIPATERMFEIVYPANGQVVDRVAEAREADIDAAIVAARTAFDDGPWPSMAPQERAPFLRRFADAIERRQGEIAAAQSTQIGVPIAMANRTAAGLANEPRRFSAFADSYAFVDERPVGGGTALIVREPVGVVAAIVPWNYPAHLGLLKMCPALLAGCTMVVKPSPEAPLDMLLLAECAAEAGFPKGVLSIVPGDRDVGDRLVRDARIDKVSFTGSTAAGRHIGAVCMDRVARVSLELGGKSAAIVLDDMPIDKAVPGLVMMSTLLNGQACIGLTRVLVSHARKDELTQALAAAYAALKVGDPFDPATQIGPLATARQQERVEGYIAKGIEEGAGIATGGGRPEGVGPGFYIQPTVFTDVHSDMTIAREEIFGPVISIITYRDVEDAIRIANDSAFGLNGAVFTLDRDMAIKLARRIRAGTVAQNGMGPQAGMPFGGYRQSGIGREGSIEALDLFTEVKAIYTAGAAA